MLYLIYFILYFMVFIFGSCIGSFLNVVIYRVPNDISIAKGRSFCPKCNEKIKDYDLIPILSYFILKRKCRSCGQKISLRYPLVEAFVGVIAIVIFMQYDFTAKAILAFAFCAILVTIALIDHDTMEIPLVLILAIIPLSILAFFVFKEVTFWERIIGIFAVTLPMFILTRIIPNAFGDGDIMIWAVCGLFLGWKLILFATFLAILLEGGYVTYKMLSKKLKKDDHIPFGPALCAGIFVSLLYGEDIIRLYLNFFKLS